MIFNFRQIKADVKLIKERQNELLKDIGLVPQTWEKNIVDRCSIIKTGSDELAKKSVFKKDIVKIFE